MTRELTLFRYRYDLLNKMYQAFGEWDKAVEVAQKKDRIHLRTTHFKRAQHMEALQDANAGWSQRSCLPRLSRAPALTLFRPKKYTQMITRLVQSMLCVHLQIEKWPDADNSFSS
jgi:hypothetical protein